MNLQFRGLTRLSMSDRLQKDSLLKPLLRTGWRAALLLHGLASAATSGGGGAPRVFYGGARSGNLGGPLVKVKRLQGFFPPKAWRYNLVYALSNAPYLPAPALEMLRRRHIPLVLNQNGVFYPGWYGGDWHAQNIVMAHAYHSAEYVFWQSEFCRRSADRFLGQRTGAGEILFNAVDLERFSPAAKRSEGPFCFLVTGKIGRHLGYRLESTIAGLAVACRAGLDARLIIAGWIEDEAAARAATARHGVAGRVDFAGRYSQEQAPNIYRAADAYVMTKYLDPCPNTVLEAMACGLPVLYSASGGVPELVGDGAGIGLPLPEDWDAVHVPAAEEIGRGMLAIAEVAAAMGAAARARAEAAFDIRHWIDRHRHVFELLLREAA
jgi:glycosyltransferase involved in cell wall biosynthesis